MVTAHLSSSLSQAASETQSLGSKHAGWKLATLCRRSSLCSVCFVHPLSHRPSFLHPQLYLEGMCHWWESHGSAKLGELKAGYQAALPQPGRIEDCQRIPLSAEPLSHVLLRRLATQHFWKLDLEPLASWFGTGFGMGNAPVASHNNEPIYQEHAVIGYVGWTVMTRLQLKDMYMQVGVVGVWLGWCCLGQWQASVFNTQVVDVGAFSDKLDQASSL